MLSIVRLRPSRSTTSTASASSTTFIPASFESGFSLSNASTIWTGLGKPGVGNPVDRGHDRDPEVDGASLHPEAEAPVLGDALLRDVQLRHDLEAADDGVVVALVEGIEGGIEDTVDPVLDEHLPVLGLDVDVRGAAVDGAQDERVLEPDDRALPGQAREVHSLGLVLGQELQAQPFARLLEQHLAAAAAPEQGRHAVGG